MKKALIIGVGILLVAATFIALYAIYVRLSLQHDYRDALEKAQKGDVDAEVAVAYMLEHGMGVEKDLEQSSKWYLSAAKGGSKQALFMICGRVNAGEIKMPKELSINQCRIEDFGKKKTVLNGLNINQ